ncbi:MAG: TCP-1/cpn60 chaperonin family protein, partial [Planctomycetota bacterium]
NVGAGSEAEMKEKKARIEDALHATRAAIEEGIVAGGGVALVRCIDAVSKLKLKADEATGAEIVANALRMPCYSIADNAGAVGNIVVNKIANGKDGFGYNADKDSYEDLIEAGVIDPVKVTRIALQNAASVAGLLLTTDCIVTDQPTDEDPAAAAAAMGGGMGGMGGGMPGMGGMGGMGGMPGMGMM